MQNNNSVTNSNLNTQFLLFWVTCSIGKAAASKVYHFTGGENASFNFYS